MSDAPTTLIPGAAGTPVTDDGDPLAPPEDLGASVLAEFARREKATAAPLGKDLGAAGEAPPGGWPDLADAAANVSTTVTVADVDAQRAAQQAGVTPPTPDPSSPADTQPGSDAASGASGGTPDAASAPAQADTTVVGAPAVSPAAEPEGTGVVEEPVPSGYTWTFHDGQAEQTVQFDDAQVQRALSVSAWAENLPEPVRQAIGSIETGQAVAIPRADYDEYAAWKAQQSRTTRDADLDQLDIDPAVAKILREQRDQIDVLRGQSPQQPMVDPQLQARVNAGAAQTAAEFDTAKQVYAQQRGLSLNEVEGLLSVAARAGIVPALVDANTQVNPANGAVLVPADIKVVAEQALDWALVRDPHLKTRVLQAVALQAAQQVQQGAQLPGTPAAPDPVQARKARAGSLATAPSGAAPPMPAQTVQQMSPQEVTHAMARDIEAIMKS